MANNKYLHAARDLLIRFGKPMHYKTITSTAMKLGLLETEGMNPEIAMSSILSRDVANNPNSLFKKLKEGVYDIVPGARIGNEIINYNKIGIRISELVKQTGIRNELMVVRRALFLLKRGFEYAGDDKKITIGNDTDSINLILDNEDGTLKNWNNAFVYEKSEFCLCEINLNINKNICIVLEELRLRSGLKTILDVVDFSIMLFELCSTFQKNGYVILKGKNGSCRLRIFSKQGNQEYA